MAKAYTFANAHSSYALLLEEILELGKPQSSRVGDTLELEDVMITFTDPVKTFTPRRKGSMPLIGEVEGAQLVSGFAANELMVDLFPKYSEYSDFWGAYGKRLAAQNQLEILFETLKNDPQTRRGIVTMWNPALDARGGHSDHPCTIGIGFRVRDGALNMSVIMRSNDIFLGSTYDFVQFAMLQQTFATALGLESGTYTHVAQSLHLYTRDIEAATAIIYNADETYKAYARAHPPEVILPLSLPGWSYEDIHFEGIGALVADQPVRTVAGQHIKEGIATRLKKLRTVDEPIISEIS